MRKITTLTSLQPKRSLARVAILERVLLHASMFFVVALFPCATPSFGLLAATETEAPADQDDSSEEEIIHAQARTRAGRDQPRSPLLVPVRDGLNLATARAAVIPRSGHRLPNHLLAPLRC